MNTRSLHFVGIGGAGMSSLARYALGAGFAVSGSDLRASPVVQELQRLGARISQGHAREHVDGAATVVVSAAIPASNVEVMTAQAAGLEVLSRGAFLAELVRDHPAGIAICGTHGKGTTAGALVAMLEAAGQQPDYILGAPRRSTGLAAAVHPGATVLVAEVDESDRTHTLHRPHHLLVNNIEADHLNVYRSLDDIVESFTALAHRFAGARATHGRCVVGCHGDGSHALIERLRADGVEHVTCGVDLEGFEQTLGEPDVVATDVEHHADGTHTFDLRAHGISLGRVRSALKGPLNLRNLVSAAALADGLGLDGGAIAAACGTYSGLVDRFHEAVSGGRLIVTDYTSHPTCIRGNLEALKHRVRGRLHAVFQPFRYSLLGHLWHDYLDALRRADHVHLAPMDAAGEVPVPGLGAGELAEALATHTTTSLHPSLADIEDALCVSTAPGDVVIVFGGGPLFELARRLATHFDPAVRL